MHIKYTLCALPVLALFACTPAPTPVTPDPAIPAPTFPPIAFGTIETADTGRCFAQTAPQSRTEVITEQVEVVPAVTADDGRVLTPPVFRAQSRPVTKTTNAGVRFETLCLTDYTPDRIATLQRALTVRGVYNGPVTGERDTATGEAIQQFQAPLGFDSPLLERTVAETLGIVPVTVLRAELPET